MKKDETEELWWCNSHGRRATHLFKGEHICDPNKGGIMIPCKSVNLTGIAEIQEVKGPKGEIINS